jgi:1-deoxy-D-xylulose-5-phosphate reductoisomerase
MTRVVLLGSTGSIGQNALDVIRRFPERFRMIGLSAHSNARLLADQIREFRPEFACCTDPSAARKLRGRIGRTKLLTGEEGLKDLAAEPKAQKVIFAISGSQALFPVLRAVKCGKQIALANKEAMVMAGPLIISLAKKNKASIIPIDSEESAIWQCLEGRDRRQLRRIYLTASGGPLRRVSPAKIKNISLKRVLTHPRWKMGRKITVDSATLMNKGLEFLETMFLFDVPKDKIKIVVHPQAIIHSMVEFVDGSVLAQLSVADMRLPIQYALTYPQRLLGGSKRLDFFRLKELNFEAPDEKKFPCLGLAYRAAAKLGSMPACLNAANEVSVGEFLKGRIKFISIPRIIEKVMDRHRHQVNPGLEDIMETDRWARQEAALIIERMN